jgi:nitroreductase
MSSGDAMTIERQKEVAGSERSPFYIDELIRGRRTKRGFTNKAVPVDLVRDILSISKFAPSSSNTQPWQCYVLSGKARERVVAAAVKAFNDNPEGLIPEYPFFPDPLHEQHLETFTKFRCQLGDAQGVERSDKVGRRRDVARQFMFFDAPVGLIFTMDRLLVPASFICYGAFLQTIMLAAQGGASIRVRSKSGLCSIRSCAKSWEFPIATWSLPECAWDTPTTAFRKTI